MQICKKGVTCKVKGAGESESEESLEGVKGRVNEITHIDFDQDTKAARRSKAFFFTAVFRLRFNGYISSRLFQAGRTGFIN